MLSTIRQSRCVQLASYDIPERIVAMNIRNGIIKYFGSVKKIYGKTMLIKICLRCSLVIHLSK